MASVESGYFFVGDLLGFSRIIENSTGAELDQRVQAWIDLVEEAATAASINNLQLISDTVFAATGPEVDGLDRLIRFSRCLLTKGIHRSLPVRGAISFGGYTWGRLTYGKAVIDGHELERGQQWIGVGCAPGLPHVSTFWSLTALVCFPLPFAGGPIRLLPAVAWEIPPPTELMSLASRNGLTRKDEIMQWDWGHKIGHTLQFRTYLRLLAKVGKSPESFYGFHPMEAIDGAV